MPTSKGKIVATKTIGNVRHVTLEDATGKRCNFWMGGPPPDWYVPEPEDDPMDGWEDIPS